MKTTELEELENPDNDLKVKDWDWDWKGGEGREKNTACAAGCG
jgi:hypothetical protein